MKKLIEKLTGFCRLLCAPRGAIVGACALVILSRAIFPNMRFDNISMWIFLIAVIVWLLPDILELLRRIKRFKKGDLEIEFEARVNKLVVKTQEAEAEADQVPELQPQTDAQYEGLSPDVTTRILDSANNPRAALITLSVEIEAALRDIATDSGISLHPRAFSPNRIFQELVENQILSPKAYDLFREFWSVRNLAVHHLSFELSEAKLYELVDLGIRLLNILKFQGGGSSSGSSSE